jgi:hypothetical protein
VQSFIAGAALLGALVFAVLGWSLFGEGGYLKLLGVLLLAATIGLLLVGLQALRGSGNPAVARVASWGFWVIAGALVLMSVSERFGG